MLLENDNIVSEKFLNDGKKTQIVTCEFLCFYSVLCKIYDELKLLPPHSVEETGLTYKLNWRVHFLNSEGIWEQKNLSPLAETHWVKEN